MTLQDRADVLHILIAAPEEAPIRAIMEQESVRREIAERRIKDHDNAAAAYYRKHYHVDWLDWRLYDLVINTGTISKGTPVELIVKTVECLR